MNDVIDSLMVLRVLHVEDNDLDAKMVEVALNSSLCIPNKLTRSVDISSSLTELKNENIDIILLDLFLPDSSGLNTLKQIKTFSPAIAIIVITGVDDETLGLQAVKFGAQDYIVKDEVNPRSIARTIRYALERNNHDQRVVELASIDMLTGLPNRIRFLAYLLQIIRNTQRLKTNLSVLYIDCDHFKLINDTFGHSIGDEFLILFAKAIQSSLRASDFFARLGGDEFVIAIQSQQDKIRSPLSVAEKILTLLQSGLLTEAGVVLDARCSIGISTYSGKQNLATPEQLLREADAAMFLSKKRGGNCVSFFNKEMEQRANRRQKLLKNLPQALARREFFLVYQPVFNCKQNAYTGLEALLRWKDSSGELISPTEFIPLLEECGMIQQVGKWVIQEAISVFKELNVLGLQSPCSWIGVNISPAQIQEKSFSEQVATIIEQTKIDPSRLKLEITESLIVQKHAQTIQAIEHLQELGCEWVMDDFGVGFSSMNYLKDLPFNRLKIDRSFVIPGCQTSEDQAIISAMIALAHALGMKVVAEGVESKSSLDFLVLEQCDYLQGFYLSKPLHIVDLKNFLESQRTTENLSMQKNH